VKRTGSLSLSCRIALYETDCSKKTAYLNLTCICAHKYQSQARTPGAPVLKQRRQIYVWKRLLLQLAEGIANRRHRHFGAFLLIAPDAPIDVVVEPHGLIRSHAVLVGPSAWHSLDSRGGRVATLIIGPDHPWFCCIEPALHGSKAVSFELSTLVRKPVKWDDVFDGAMQCDAMYEFIHDLLSTMAGRRIVPNALDPTIEAVVDHIDAEIGRPGGTAIGLVELSARVRLTAFTLMRRFKRQLGVNIREYVLWRRLLSVIPLLDGKRTLTEIAHLTGFYDQAHFTRTARRMFDLQPSNVAGANAPHIHVCTCIDK
jgi:AraC family transcriptional regulator of arabinose operon